MFKGDGIDSPVLCTVIYNFTSSKWISALIIYCKAARKRLAALCV